MRSPSELADTGSLNICRGEPQARIPHRVDNHQASVIFRG
jgi:hypothetical protein